MRLENYEEGPQVEGALQELSNGGFELKISQFLAEIWPFFYFFTKMAVTLSKMVQFSNGNQRWKAENLYFQPISTRGVR